MTPTLHAALRSALQVSAECDPREMDARELAELDALDNRAFDIMDILIREHDECGPAARAVLAKAMRRPS